jgi:hypothetical protein
VRCTISRQPLFIRFIAYWLYLLHLLRRSIDPIDPMVRTLQYSSIYQHLFASGFPCAKLHTDAEPAVPIWQQVDYANGRLAKLGQDALAFRLQKALDICTQTS